MTAHYAIQLQLRELTDLIAQKKLERERTRAATDPQTGVHSASRRR